MNYMQNNYQTNAQTIRRSSWSLLQTPCWRWSAVTALFAVFICCTTSYSQTPDRFARPSVRRQTVLRPTFNSNYDNYSNTGSSLNLGVQPQQPVVVNPFERFQGEVSAIESDMIQDAKDSRFDRYTLFEAALIAAGNTDAAKLEEYKQQYNNRVYQLAQLMPQNATELQKARIILEYLHREMFREYLLESSNVGAIFDSGIYNCVTGATLFNSLARHFGVNAVALELPGHAMSRVYLSDGTYYDVETTCAIWDVKASKSKDVIILEGSVSTQELKDKIDAAFAGEKVTNKVKVLELSQPVTRRWALVKLAVATLRCEPKHSAEVATQAVMGTPVKVLDKQGDWYRVVTPDDYISFIPESSIIMRSEQQMKQWRDSQRVIVTAFASSLRETPSSEYPVSDLVLSCILQVQNNDGEWLTLTTPDGRKGYVKASDVADLNEWKTQAFDAARIEHTARLMTGCGYLWGGTSTKVSDCSGLVKVAYLSNGIILQRDASQQALTGQKIADWHNCQLGDLLFFGNSKTGRVTHVGLYLRDGKYIHCSGQVKINSLNKGDSDYLYSPLSISRIQGQIGTRGITTLAAHPWYCNQ